MELDILSLEKAVGYNPTKPTLAIRLNPSYAAMRVYRIEEIPLLKRSNLYVAKLAYVFDDIVPEEKEEGDGFILFNEDIAVKIIQDFKKYKNSAEVLMIHCMYGNSRSPAVAFALNDIFHLWHDAEREQYFQLNEFVYQMIMDVSQRIKL